MNPRAPSKSKSLIFLVLYFEFLLELKQHFAYIYPLGWINNKSRKLFLIIRIFNKEWVANSFLTKLYYYILTEGKVIWSRLFFLLTTGCQWELFTSVIKNLLVLETIIAEYCSLNKQIFKSIYGFCVGNALQINKHFHIFCVDNFNQVFSIHFQIFLH